MIELRDYQKELLSRVQSELQPDKARVMMQLPTGGGKTVIAAHLLKNRLVNGRKAVWLTHRKELVNQTRRMLSDAGIAVYPGDGWGDWNARSDDKRRRDYPDGADCEPPYREGRCVEKLRRR